MIKKWLIIIDGIVFIGIIVYMNQTSLENRETRPEVGKLTKNMVTRLNF